MDVGWRIDAAGGFVVGRAMLVLAEVALAIPATERVRYWTHVSACEDGSRSFLAHYSQLPSVLEGEVDIEVMANAPSVGQFAVAAAAAVEVEFLVGVVLVHKLVVDLQDS